MTTVRDHIRANLVGYVAIFIALGGTAYAAVELGRNSVKSKHIAPGAVKRSDIGRNAVNSAKVADGTLLGADFAPGQLPAGAQGPTGPAGSPDTPAQVLEKVKQVDGSGSGLDADLLDGSDAAALTTVGRTGSSSCQDDSGTGTDCVDVTLSLPAAGRVLLNAAGQTYIYSLDDAFGANAGTDATNRVEGNCRFRVDGFDSGQIQDYRHFSPSGSLTGDISLTGVTGVLGAGSHTFTLRCRETDGDIDFNNLWLTAVRLGAG